MAPLKLLKYLPSSCAIPRLEAETKQDAIEELLRAVAAAGVLRDADAARKDVFDRERQMSTGLTDGLAIPHAKTSGVDDVVVAVGLKPEGVDFESLDGQPTQAVFLVLSQMDRAGPHLECLAEIAQFYARPDARARMLAANTPREMLDALAD